MLCQITDLLRGSLVESNEKHKEYDLKQTLMEIFASKIYKNKLAEIAEDEAEFEEEMNEKSFI